jgi:SAUR family protein
VEAEEVYGFKTAGPLAIPCDEAVFEEILRVVSRSDPSKMGRFFNLEDLKRCCHVGMRKNIKLLGESRPLLHG